MRICSNCNIKIEGSRTRCPLCQNELHGEASKDVYPSNDVLKAGSLAYKIQLFVFICIMIIALAAEFFMGIKAPVHYSLILCALIIGGQIWLVQLIRRHNCPSHIISLCGWWTAVLSFIVLYFLGFIKIYVYYVMPILAIIAMILHFVYMLRDREHNAMAYFLGCSGLCLLIGIIPMLITHERTYLWAVSLLLGIIALVGGVIFKGRSVAAELYRRFHF